MAEWTVDVTDEEIDAALEDAAALPIYPSALTAKYDRALDVILLSLDNGRRLVIPREEMQGLQTATESQIADIQIFGGTDISWPQLDLDHNLLSLLKGRYGSDEWMQHLGKQAVAA